MGMHHLFKVAVLSFSPVILALDPGKWVESGSAQASYSHQSMVIISSALVSCVIGTLHRSSINLWPVMWSGRAHKHHQLLLFSLLSSYLFFLFSLIFFDHSSLSLSLFLCRLFGSLSLISPLFIVLWCGKDRKRNKLGYCFRSWRGLLIWRRIVWW